MPEVKLCLACNKPMTGFRSHALTCSSTCRGIRWRANKKPMVPVKLAFSATHFAAIGSAAESYGVSISQFVHDRVVHSMECSQ